MIDPAVVRQLQPFIVTSWHGHRNDTDLPKPVRDVWNWKFQVLGDMRQSNVDLAVLAPDGRVMHSFDAFERFPLRSGESLAEYTARELKRGLGLLDLEGIPARNNPLRLPDLDGKQGVRIFVTLKDDRMRAYRAPIVEVIPLTTADWQLLTYPQQPRELQARDLHKWLSQVYPPGVMERTDPRTKKVYEISSTEGTLSLIPAAGTGTMRQAILSGQVQFRDEGNDGFSYQGDLQVVLTYPIDKQQPSSLRGVFEGVYPRRDRFQNRNRQVPL
ncbi:MAG: hypothetical protein VB817_11360, partial [Pirellulaceae bacterium]